MRSTCPIASVASLGLPVLYFLVASLGSHETSAAQTIQLSHPTQSSPTELSTHSIHAMIAQLDDNDFSLRRIALERLQAQSDIVADYLFTVAEQGSIDQRYAAQKLIQHARQTWKQKIDDPAIRPKVNFMGESSILQKLTAIRQIAAQQSDSSQTALLQICRLESETLSLVAARCLLQQIDSAKLNSNSNNTTVIAIHNALLNSDRTASRWVKLALSTDSDSPIWSELAMENFDHIDQNPNIHPIERDAHLALVQWHLNRCFENSPNKPTAENLLSAPIQELEKKYVEAIEHRVASATILWLAKHKRSKAIKHYYDSNQTAVDRDPVSLLAMAALFEKTGEHDRAANFIRLADKATGTSPTHHLELGVTLYSLGMPRQAKRVLRRGISHATPDSTLLFQCRLVDAYYRQQERDFAGAAKQLWAIHKRINENTTLKSRIQKCGVSSEEIVATAKFNESMTCSNMGQQLQLLLEATELAPHNSDILIGLYRISTQTGLTAHASTGNVPSWSIEIDDLIRLSLDEMDSEVAQLEAQLPHCQHSRLAKSMESQIAMLVNRTAWIRVKTDRELSKAILHARRACELRPHNAAMLDTLAHCEFSNGLFDNAIQTQRKAIVLDPYHPGFKRTLNRFERELQQRWVASLPVVIMR